MNIFEELRMIYIFCKEAALTKYYQTPNYDRFKFLAHNIYHFVGLARMITRVSENGV
jgi:hypothetical protein